jgi:hypothetical protein
MNVQTREASGGLFQVVSQCGIHYFVIQLVESIPAHKRAGLVKILGC